VRRCQWPIPMIGPVRAVSTSRVDSSFWSSCQSGRCSKTRCEGCCLEPDGVFINSLVSKQDSCAHPGLQSLRQAVQFQETLDGLNRRSPLWGTRGHVSSDRNHVVLVQLRNDSFHQFAHATSASAGLKVIELSDDIERRASCDPGHLAQAG